jgi:GR25 family glycosyltransferase involved in LPS biosynthesis
MKLTVFLVVLVFVFLRWLNRTPVFDYHVIHLSHRTDRMNHVREMEKRIGHTLNIFKASGPSVLEGWKPGEVGCYQSHMRILSTPRHTEYSVIFEDDFVVQPGFHSSVEKIIRDAGDFDILYLGNLDGNHAERVKGDVYKADTTRYLTGMHGYVIKNENAWKITSKLQYKKPIDLELPDLIKTGDVNGLVVWPSIVSQHSGLKSSIRV